MPDTRVDPPLLVSAATVTIAPTREVPLGGSRRDGGDWSIESVPEFTIAALWSEGKTPLVLASIDSLYPGALLRRVLQENLPEVPAANIVLGATHTHFAPMTDESKPALGAVDPDHLDLVVTRIAAAARQVMSPGNRRAARAFAGTGKGKFAINRRRIQRLVWGIPPRYNVPRSAPSRRGPRDDTITTLEFLDEKDRTIAIIWNYACHPVEGHSARTVSTHFPGVVREALRDGRAPDLPVVYFQGFSGDVRPRPTGTYILPRGTQYQKYMWLRQGPRFLPFKKVRYDRWTAAISRRVERVLAGARPINLLPLAVARLEVDRSEFAEPEGASLSFQAIRLRNSLGILAVSAEVVADYAQFARKLLGTDMTMLVSCTDETFGYIPTRRMLGQGLYEEELSLPRFGIVTLNPMIQTNTERALAACASRVTGAKYGAV